MFRRSIVALLLVVVCIVPQVAAKSLSARQDDSSTEPLAHAVRSGVHSEEELIQVFAQAYRTKNFTLYQTLFVSEDEHQVPFTFFLVGGDEDGTTQWGYDEEMRIHQRMFCPETLPQSEKLKPALWAERIDLELHQKRGFVERYDLYRSDAEPTGLDRKRWRATDAEYATNLVVTTRGAGTFRVVGTANFVVIEDLHKPLGDGGKFLIYHWVDEGQSHNAGRRAAR